MKSRNILFTILLLVVFASCNDSENKKLIVGKWSGKEWLVNGKPSSLDAGNTHFTFMDNGDYTYDYAGNQEKGTYKVENDMLFTTPTDQQEIMVKITKLTKDSLVFEMNRSGQSESLVLLKE